MKLIIVGFGCLCCGCLLSQTTSEEEIGGPEQMPPAACLQMIKNTPRGRGGGGAQQMVQHCPHVRESRGSTAAHPVSYFSQAVLSLSEHRYMHLSNLLQRVLQFYEHGFTWLSAWILFELKSPCLQPLTLPLLVYGEKNCASDFLVSQQNKSSRNTSSVWGQESERTDNTHRLLYKVCKQLFHLKSYLWMRWVFFLAETGRKVAVKTVNVTQILLTFPVACLLASLKRAIIKNKSKTFHTGWMQKRKHLCNADSVCNVCRLF